MYEARDGVPFYEQGGRAVPGELFVLDTSQTKATAMNAIARRVVPSAVSRLSIQRRCASHGAPHYNEPTGFLFGEKVSHDSPLTRPFTNPID